MKGDINSFHMRHGSLIFSKRFQNYECCTFLNYLCLVHHKRLNLFFVPCYFPYFPAPTSHQPAGPIVCRRQPSTNSKLWRGNKETGLWMRVKPDADAHMTHAHGTLLHFLRNNRDVLGKSGTKSLTMRLTWQHIHGSSVQIHTKVWNSSKKCKESIIAPQDWVMRSNIFAWPSLMHMRVYSFMNVEISLAPPPSPSE